MGANDLSLTRVNFKTNFRKIKEMNEINVIYQPLDMKPNRRNVRLDETQKDSM